MELTNEFTVPVPIERAWDVLNDVELIAPCLPGAQLHEIEGDEYRGVVKVKVGPITAQYKGAATFREQDLENRRVVLDASGRDTRGQGSASAVVTATMSETTTDGQVSTHVTVDTDLTIKGKVAQFGRGMIAEVSANLLTQFVDCLEGKLDAEPTEAAAAPAEAAAEPAGATASDVEEDVADAATAVQGGGALGAETVGNPAAEAAKQDASGSEDGPAQVRRVEHAENAPVDLLGAAGTPIVKRAAPAVVVFLILVFLGRWRSKKRRS